MVLVGSLRLSQIWGQGNLGEVYFSLGGPKSSLGPGLLEMESGLYREWGVTRWPLPWPLRAPLASLGASLSVMTPDEMPTDSGPAGDQQVSQVGSLRAALHAGSVDFRLAVAPLGCCVVTSGGCNNV